ncbi:M20/M25/M40 family metallo-hydrolase [Bacteroidota bacterium]
MKKLRNVILAVFSLTFLFNANILFAQEKGSGVESITIKELKDHMEYLASDELGGRVTGTDGYKKAAKYAAKEFAKAKLQTLFKNSDGEPSYFQPVKIKDYVSMNVVGMVEGTDTELKNQYVTVGAHLDHVNYDKEKVWNGADDNASGSVGVIEIAEALVLNPPKRSVIFILFTGEEKGLLGSRHFVKDPPVPLDDIVANINLDMIGRTGQGLDKKKKEHIVRYSSEVCPEFKKFVQKVNKKTINYPLVYKDESTEQTLGGSDHMSFLGKDIPAIFFFSGIHKDLHRPTDDADKIEYDKMQKISQLVYEITVELGNADEVFGK